MRTYTVQVTEIFAVHRSEYKVAIFFTVTDKTKWSKPTSKLLEWNDTIWWICSNDLVRTIGTNNWSVWFALHQVNDLSISVKHH